MSAAEAPRCAVCKGAFTHNERYATAPSGTGEAARAHLPCADMAMFLRVVLNLQSPVDFAEVPTLWRRFCLLGQLTHQQVNNQYEQGQRLARLIDSRFAPKSTIHRPWAQGLSFLQDSQEMAHAQ